MGSYKVELHIYDLSYGMAKYLSPLIVGKFVEGVWHTSVVVYGYEYTYGNDGVHAMEVPENPMEKIVIGYTAIPRHATDAFVTSLANNDHTKEAYSLFENNCHTFSNKLTQFLCNEIIPEKYTKLPENILGTNKAAGARRIAARVALSSTAAVVAAPQSCLPLFGSSALCSSSSSTKKNKRSFQS